MKHTERDCITVEKLVFFMIFVENLIFPVISVESVKLNNFPLVGTRFDFKNIILSDLVHFGNIYHRYTKRKQAIS